MQTHKEDKTDTGTPMTNATMRNKPTRDENDKQEKRSNGGEKSSYGENRSKSSPRAKTT